MSNKILVDVMDAKQFDAGTKARNDVMNILTAAGFEPTITFYRTHGTIRRMIEALGASVKVFKNLREGEMILLQYPYHVTIMNLFLKRIAKYKKRVDCKLVILVHDVSYLRGESYVKGGLEKMKEVEISFFNQVDALIVHNAAMREKLKADGVTAEMYELGVFDYLYDGESAHIPEGTQTEIVFAGNLKTEKSAFLYQVPLLKNIKFNLYGQHFEQERSSLDYKGNFAPDDLIQNLSGHYGLVWDGNSTESCEGAYGGYLKFNNPHKFSLYITAGLPVVVWRQSALAKFAEERGVGIVIDRLSDLEHLPNAQSEEYKNMQQRVRVLACDLKEGKMLTNVIQQIMANGLIRK